MNSENCALVLRVLLSGCHEGVHCTRQDYVHVKHIYHTIIRLLMQMIN